MNHSQRRTLLARVPQPQSLVRDPLTSRVSPVAGSAKAVSVKTQLCVP